MSPAEKFFKEIVVAAKGCRFKDHGLKMDQKAAAFCCLNCIDDFARTVYDDTQGLKCTHKIKQKKISGVHWKKTEEKIYGT
mgnify:FL=1